MPHEVVFAAPALLQLGTPYCIFLHVNEADAWTESASFHTWAATSHPQSRTVWTFSSAPYTDAGFPCDVLVTPIEAAVAPVMTVCKLDCQ